MRAFFALLTLALPAMAEPVTLVPYADLEPRLVTRVDFEDFPRRLSPGVQIDGIQRVEGAAMGERFQGQLIWQEDGFDRVGPLADAPQPRDGAGRPGAMTVQFFTRDARLIASMPVTLGWGRKAYGSVRAGEEPDIAGITITNADPAGIAIDDLIFDHDLAIGWRDPNEYLGQIARLR